MLPEYKLKKKIVSEDCDSITKFNQELVKSIKNVMVTYICFVICLLYPRCLKF